MNEIYVACDSFVRAQYRLEKGIVFATVIARTDRNCSYHKPHDTHMRVQFLDLNW